MLGSQRNASGPTSVGPSALLSQMTNSSASANMAQSSALSIGSTAIPWVVVGLVVLYLAWAIVQQHQRVQDEIEPRNVALNLHNLWALALPVIVFILLLKVAAGKYAAWKLPGYKAITSVVGAI